MSESELSINYDGLLLEVAAFLGYGSVSTSWSDTQLAELVRYVKSGVRRFYYPPAMEGVEVGYQWSFLNVVATLDTVSGTGTQDLPPNLERVVGGFYYPQDTYRASIVQVSEDRYRQRISRTTSTGQPKVVRVRHKPKQDGTGHRLEVSWWPVPDAAYTLTYQSKGYTGPLDASNQYPLGGMHHSELLIESCLAVAELRANDERGMHTAEFEDAMRAAVEQDRRNSAAHYGHMGDLSDGRPVVPRHGDTGSAYDISYAGVTI